uniref:Uncharacterized protein n=1 Tax=Arundo donax TaxID=35708 RepID=A0A0A9DF08_ARUDO
MNMNMMIYGCMTPSDHSFWRNNCIRPSFAISNNQMLKSTHLKFCRMEYCLVFASRSKAEI